MSDLSLLLRQADSQLPVSSYFDETLAQRERAVIFDRSPKYIGHGLAVPAIGDYYTLPQEAGGRVLLRYSGTEPKARLLIEGPDQAVLEKWTQSICDAIKKHVGV